MLAHSAKRLVKIFPLNQVINELFDDLERAGVGSDQAAEEIRALVFFQPVPASHFNQLAQDRSALVLWSGCNHPLARCGFVCETRAAMVEVGEFFERRQTVLFKLGVTQRLALGLFDVAQLFVKLGQLQFDLGVLRIKLSDFSQSRAGFRSGKGDDGLRTEKFGASEQRRFDLLGALFRRRLCLRGCDRALRRDDRQSQR